MGAGWPGEPFPMASYLQGPKSHLGSLGQVALVALLLIAPSASASSPEALLSNRIS